MQGAGNKANSEQSELIQILKNQISSLEIDRKST